VGLSGCTEATPLASAGVVLSPPAGWRKVDRSTWLVPGAPLAAWAGPGGSSLVVYRTLAIPGGKADQVLTELATRLSNLPGLKIVAQRVEKAGSLPAARVEAVAPGTGDALAPTGMGSPTAPAGKTLVPTRRILLTVPRQGDTLALVWHAPESEAVTLISQVEATLQSLTIVAGRGAAASY
jgi:hypothetical protein